MTERAPLPGDWIDEGSSPAWGRTLRRYVLGAATGYSLRPWQTLYFLPEPHGHSALRGVPGNV